MKNKILNYLIKRQNKKTDREMHDYYFLQSLCIDNNGTLDLNKYHRLLSMVKRKYKR